MDLDKQLAVATMMADGRRPNTKGDKEMAVRMMMAADNDRTKQQDAATTASNTSIANSEQRRRGRLPSFVMFFTRPSGVVERVDDGNSSSRRWDHYNLRGKHMPIDTLVQHVTAADYETYDDEEHGQEFSDTSTSTRADEQGPDQNEDSEGLAGAHETHRKRLVGVLCRTGFLLVAVIIIAAVTAGVLVWRTRKHSASVEDEAPELPDAIDDSNTCVWPDNWKGCGTEIKFSNKRLSGVIPHTIMQATNVTHLDLSANDLTGTIPSELGVLTGLTFLRFTFNQLTGTIPTEIGLLSQLYFLSFSNNKLEGTIPSEIGSLTGLAQLDMPGGMIPSEVGLLSNLVVLEIQPSAGKTSGLFVNNTMERTIPTEIGLLENLVTLLLVGTDLTGTIPIEIQSLSRLNELNIHENDYLRGALPSEVGKLESLVDLIVDHTPLSGTIPTELGLVANLETLILSRLDITGVVPSEIGRLTNLSEIDFRNEGLSGTFPDEACHLGVAPMATCRTDGCNLPRLLECHCCLCRDLFN